MQVAKGAGRYSLGSLELVPVLGMDGLLVLGGDMGRVGIIRLQAEGQDKMEKRAFSRAYKVLFQGLM